MLNTTSTLSFGTRQQQRMGHLCYSLTTDVMLSCCWYIAGSDSQMHDIFSTLICVHPATLRKKAAVNMCRWWHYQIPSCQCSVRLCKVEVVCNCFPSIHKTRFAYWSLTTALPAGSRVPQTAGWMRPWWMPVKDTIPWHRREVWPSYPLVSCPQLCKHG